MRVDIWSDIVCPFCYIGKRRFENALEGFDDKVEIVWHSYQLDPEAKYEEGQTLDQYLSKRKGLPLEKASEMNAYVTAQAAELGLNYNLDTAKIANTLDAHRLLHLAAKYGKQNEVKETLLAAYFTEGKNISDAETLVNTGQKHGLDADEVRRALNEDAYKQDVEEDIYHARQIGVQGVPFFVFNNKYAVSGAQPTELFKQVLDKVKSEEKPQVLNADGDFCGPDENC
ncbi:DsbA family oxidoreductase [Mucilaginibacter sp. UR6-1]|uniref:DsbA family oxidoreductase n=1 Tax=Mucilaginibacter sp. UR6-1 TaxID=1435643 RepID=UPI001E5EF165|nr:DsbA family oxidoreductase [Mucilaginibacter sp. UR6-1]MCC8410102.1 DsbA family oxidoreductase [Mucilaginibacter sp. UR6-1]